MKQSFAYFTIGIAGAMPATSALAQDEDAVEHNNFVQPADLVTTELGSLGEVVSRGDGPVHLVLITDHDWDWSIWESFMDRNADRYTMHAVTAAGVGDTLPPALPEEYTESLVEIPWYNGFVSGVESMIRQKGLDKPVLVGFRDSGSYVAYRVALDNPGLVGGIISVAGGPRAFFGGGPPVLDTPTDAQARFEYIKENFLPFAKGFAPEVWKQGGIRPIEFSVNPETSERLIPLQRTGRADTHIRYRMELYTTNSAPFIGSLQVPVLAIIPEYDFDDILNDSAKRFAEQFGGEDAAKEAIYKQWTDGLGGEEGARDGILRYFQKSTVAWDRAAGLAADIRVERVKGSRVFLMLDQPERFDELVAEFVK